MVAIGFLLGLLVSSIVLGVIDAAVSTIYVTWVEANEPLARFSPDLHAKMWSAWEQAQKG
eukprot:37611-Eustigmatos_ZCMA.PRE.1